MWRGNRDVACVVVAGAIVVGNAAVAAVHTSGAGSRPASRTWEARRATCSPHQGPATGSHRPRPSPSPALLATIVRDTSKLDHRVQPEGPRWSGSANAAGWHEVKIISERLGHANVAITIDTYSHVLPAADAATAHTLAKLILGGP